VRRRAWFQTQRLVQVVSADLPQQFRLRLENVADAHPVRTNEEKQAALIAAEFAGDHAVAQT
jgi:hypothetical protein